MDINAIPRHCLGFELLAHNCKKKSRISPAYVDSCFEAIGEKIRKNEIFHGCSAFFYAAHSGGMGDALFALGWDLAFADNFHSFEFCASK